MIEFHERILEVIATSVADALEAERGGADRVELIRDLASRGLTPPVELVRAVLDAVKIPVRVMLRENASNTLRGQAELDTLRRHAAAFAQLPIDGLVLGFTRNGALDMETAHAVLQSAPHCRATFHRAFEELTDSELALKQLRELSQVDRILTSGGALPWEERKRSLHALQVNAGARFRVIAGGGLNAARLAELAMDPVLHEFHIGRAARRPRQTGGTVHWQEVKRLRALLVPNCLGPTYEPKPA